MRCEECGALADERAAGWRALIADDPDDDEPAEVETFTFRFPSAEAFVNYFGEHYGPTLKALAAAGDRARDLISALVSLASGWSRLDEDGPVAIPATYLASIGIRAAS